MFCPECGNFAASKAISELEANGQVGKTKVRIDQTFLNREKFSGFTANESIGSYQYDKFDDAYDALSNALQGFLRANPNATVLVEWDNVLYKCSVSLDGPFTLIGNGAIKGEEQLCPGNGEPFYMWFGLTQFSCYTKDTATTHTVAIYDGTETIHPIDPKFLPGPVVLDLTKFRCVYDGEVAETTLNEVVRSLVSRSINGGGTLVTASVTDIDDVFAAVGSNRDIIIRTDLLEGVETEGRPTVVRLNSFPVQLASVYPIVISNTMFDVSVCFVKSQLGVDMYASAKPIT